MLTALKSGPRSAPAQAKARAKKSITELYAEFEKAHGPLTKMNQLHDRVLKEAGLGRKHQCDTLEDIIEAGHKTSAAYKARGLDAAWHKRFEAAAAKCNKLARRITMASAASIPEILIKLRVVSWQNHLLAHDFDGLEQYDDWTGVQGVEETEAARILAGLHADLRRLAAH